MRAQTSKYYIGYALYLRSNGEGQGFDAFWNSLSEEDKDAYLEPVKDIKTMEELARHFLFDDNANGGTV